MSIGILGNKIGMTQIFDDKGNLIPVTVIKTGKSWITQIKSEETCGYNAIQIGYLGYSKKAKNLSKPELGHLKKNDLPALCHLKEFKVDNINNYKIGQELTIEILNNKKFVSISGLTTGKGYAGNIKRHGFSRGAMTHGSKHHRLQGSLGAGTTPGRVFPGKKMSGRMGNEKRTVKNLEIVERNLEENLLIVKGCLPGKTGNLLTII